jgi:hypothetical protein
MATNTLTDATIKAVKAEPKPVKLFGEADPARGFGG